MNFNNISLFITVFALISSVNGKAVTVSQNDSKNRYNIYQFSTIEKAISAIALHDIQKRIDTILVYPGEYNSLKIKNRSNILILSKDPLRAMIKGIRLANVSNIHIKGFKVNLQDETKDMIHISGNSRDIIIDSCEIFSIESSTDWSDDDWRQKAKNGIFASGSHITICNNLLKNIRNGITIQACSSLVQKNTIDHFSGDGMRGLGDYSTFSHNIVRNVHRVDNNHLDGFQSWSRGSNRKVGSGVCKGITLEGNTFISYTDSIFNKNASMQGIGCFDGMYQDWVIENNLIFINHTHGITFCGAINCRITNNTVICRTPNTSAYPHIRITAHKNGLPGSNCIVANNVACTFSLVQGIKIAKSNIEIKNPNLIFKNCDQLDFTLLKNSPIINNADVNYCPSYDLLGNKRPSGVGPDIGAFEFQY